MTPLEVYDRYQREWSDIGLHLPWLREHARGKVLEIGVREGISTAALLLGATHYGGHVWSVDISDCSQLYTYPNVEAVWTFVQANSRKDSDKVLEAMGADKDFELDLLFVDGDHTYEGAMSDLCTYGPFAKTIAVHDTGSRYHGVWEALICYYRQMYHERDFIGAEFRNRGYGLGVLYR